jgi:hypothetical protein
MPARMEAVLHVPVAMTQTRVIFVRYLTKRISEKERGGESSNAKERKKRKPQGQTTKHASIRSRINPE